jgi:hypothetical protein
MTFTVYHFDASKYMCSFGKWNLIKGNDYTPCDRPALEEYTKVAEVEADGIEKVFELTNHIDHDWTTNEGVTAFGRQQRSTSVGDIVINNNGTQLLCASLGWEEI